MIKVNTDNRIASALEALAGSWLPVFADHALLRYPLGVEVPTTADAAWLPFVAAKSPGASVTVVQEAASGEKFFKLVLPPTNGVDIEAGVFLTVNGLWTWAEQLAFKTARFRFPVIYPTKPNFTPSAANYLQIGLDGKLAIPSDTLRTAIQTNLDVDAAGNFGYWGVVGDQDIHPVIATPIVYGVPLAHEYLVDFDTDPAKGACQFTYGDSVIAGSGRTLSLGQGTPPLNVPLNSMGLGFVAHGNMLPEGLTVLIGAPSVEVKVK